MVGDTSDYIKLLSLVKKKVGHIFNSHVCRIDAHVESVGSSSVTVHSRIEWRV